MFHLKKAPPFCLVLSGGGAKGVYHIGVWKALKELGIPVQAFMGNSIGAIMAGFLAQGKDRELERIGDNIGIDFIMKVPEELVEKGELKIGKGQLPAFRKFYQSVVQKKGIDVSPLRNLLYTNLNEDEIRRSGRDLGVVTFNMTDVKGVKTYADEMEPGTLLEYLMASAAFPGLEQTVIRGKKFIDGGVHDNMPYDMALARGYKHIIVVDISGMGVNRRPSIEGTNTIYIKNSINMGGVFDFNREFLHRFKTLGYLDALKTFDVLKGQRYFFDPDKRAERGFFRRLEAEPGGGCLERSLPAFRREGSPAERDRLIRTLLPEGMRKHRELFYCLADCCAGVFALDRVARYSPGQMLREAAERKEAVDRRIAELRSSVTGPEKAQMMKKLSLFLKEAGRSREEPESPYYYYRLVRDVLEQEEGSLLMKGLAGYYPELRGGLFFFNAAGGGTAGEIPAE